MRIFLLAIIFVLSSTVQADEEEALTVTVKRLTLESATRIAQGAIKSCRDKGIQVGVTVVDRNGIAQVMLRDTLAPEITIRISQGKAAAAANFSTDTRALTSRANTAIGRVPGLVMSTGGVLVQAGGVLYGAVGVSGAPSGDTDEECAKAGLESVLEDLEMAM